MIPSPKLQLYPAIFPVELLVKVKLLVFKHCKLLFTENIATGLGKIVMFTPLSVPNATGLELTTLTR